MAGCWRDADEPRPVRDRPGVTFAAIVIGDRVKLDLASGQRADAPRCLQHAHPVGISAISTAGACGAAAGSGGLCGGHRGRPPGHDIAGTGARASGGRVHGRRGRGIPRVPRARRVAGLGTRAGEQPASTPVASPGATTSTGAESSAVGVGWAALSPRPGGAIGTLRARASAVEWLGSALQFHISAKGPRTDLSLVVRLARDSVRARQSGLGGLRMRRAPFGRRFSAAWRRNCRHHRPRPLYRLSAVDS